MTCSIAVTTVPASLLRICVCLCGDVARTDTRKLLVTAAATALTVPISSAVAPECPPVSAASRRARRSWLRRTSRRWSDARGRSRRRPGGCRPRLLCRVVGRCRHCRRPAARPPVESHDAVVPAMCSTTRSQFPTVAKPPLCVSGGGAPPVVSTVQVRIGGGDPESRDFTVDAVEARPRRDPGRYPRRCRHIRGIDRTTPIVSRWRS